MMRTTKLMGAVILACAANVGTVMAADDFATLKGVKSVAMTAEELDSVKGMHIHFLDANGGFHIAGNPANSGIGTGNWYLNGSPDGQPVHPSYHGLCVAGPILIPTGPNPSQCP